MQPYSKYEKLEPLGRGPTATVYRGRHSGLGIEVAIKELHQNLSPAARRRIFKGVDVWAKLSHDHLISIRDVDPASGWIITDLMQGSLARLVSSGPMEPERGRDILLECLSALDYIHTEKRCLHGNIKPSNLLYDAQMRVRLSDGHGIRIDDPGEMPAPTGSCKYLAPEMLGESSVAISPRADLYCLGFTMLEMLIGPRFNSLFKGVGEDAQNSEMAWLRWHSSPNQQAPRTCDEVSNVPYELGIVIDRLLCKDVVQRYQSARDALEDLRGQTSRAAAPSMRVSDSQPLGPAPRETAADSSAPPQPVGVRPSAPVSTPDAIPQRPNTSVVLRIASGPRAGEMLGLDCHEFSVGPTEQCQVHFDPEQYPGVTGRSLVLRREAESWRIKQEGRGGLIVNRQPVEQTASIRSGDLVRMSAWGPDFQFIIQEPNEESLAKIAAAFLPAGSGADSSSSARPLPTPQAAAPAMAPPSAPAPPASSAPAAPVPPLGPTGTVPELSGFPGQFAPQPPKPAPSTSSAPSPAQDGTVTAPAQPTDGVKAGGEFSLKKLLDYSQWDKKTTNWVIAIVGSIIALVIVFLVPVKKGPDQPEHVAPESQQETTSDGAESSPSFDGEKPPPLQDSH